MIKTPILIVAGEPNSVFFEIFFKSISKKKFKSPIILIGSKIILEKQMKQLNFNFKINLINEKNVKLINLSKTKINLINIEFYTKKTFEKISNKSQHYIERSFNIALRLLKKKITHKFINGPISKKYFLNKKYLGISEYLVKKTKSRNYAMLIFNKNLSVSPITTHLPIKYVSKKITKKKIIDKIKLINSFYKKVLLKKPSIAVTGLNPHCESIDKYDEDLKVLKPSIIQLKSYGLKISGPFSADTIFLKNNRKKFDVIVGMYHDQVLTPIKTLFEYDAINITLGLPFIRISPDHGPNEKMLGKNLSNPLSLIRALEFFEKMDK